MQVQSAAETTPNSCVKSASIMTDASTLKQQEIHLVQVQSLAGNIPDECDLCGALPAPMPHPCNVHTSISAVA